MQPTPEKSEVTASGENDNGPGQLAIDALIAEARKTLRGYRAKSRHFNTPVGEVGMLVDLAERLTDALFALHRERSSPFEEA